MARRGRSSLGAIEMKTLLLMLLLAVAGEDAGVQSKVYVQGSSLNLREQACKDAQVLVQLPIGTECAVVGEAPAEWMQVRCGESTGYVAAALVGPDKPSVETLRAEALNPSLPPERREESALRASLLAPEDAELSKLLGELFFERNFRLTERFKPQPNAVRRTFSKICGSGQVNDCLRETTQAFVRDIKLRAETRKNLFVVAVSDAEKITVYRGRFEFVPAKGIINAEVLETNSFLRTPVMDKALFAGIKEERFVKEDVPFGRFVLDEQSQVLLRSIPSAWALLELNAEGLRRMPFNDCLKKPYQLEFHPDIHGRWKMLREKGAYGRDVFWITAVTKLDTGLELSLAPLYGEGMSRRVLKLPETGKDVGYLDDILYTFKLQRYPIRHDECKEGGP